MVGSNHRFRCRHRLVTRSSCCRSGVFYKRVKVDLPSSYMMFDFASLMQDETAQTNWNDTLKALLDEHEDSIGGLKRKSSATTLPPPPPPLAPQGRSSPASGKGRSNSTNEWLDPKKKANDEITQLIEDLSIDREAAKSLRKLADDVDEDLGDQSWHSAMSVMHPICTRTENEATI